MKSEQLHLGGRWEIELWAPVVLLLPASSAVTVEPALEAPNICFCRCCCCCCSCRCCCCCCHINSHNQVRVTGQAPVTLNLRNTPREKAQQPKMVHAYITADAIHASARNIKESKRWPVYDVPGPYWCIRLTTRADENGIYRLPTTTYILHVVPTTAHTHVRCKSIGNEKHRKERKEDERKAKERK